jgi:hypothetical protein
MPGEPESIIDPDVSGDAFQEGQTSAIDDDVPIDDATFMSSGNDENRLAYIEDVFAGSSDKVTPWKSLSSSVSNIQMNAAESRLLGSMKETIDPILSTSSRLVEKPIDAMKPSDFASMYASRDWYLMLLDYINARIPNPADKTTPKETFEMTRVWMLQCIYGETAKNVFINSSEWYMPVRRINISYNRYSFIMRKLGNDLLEITVTVGINHAEEDTAAELVWGSFNEHNDIMSKLENHVGNIGKNFLFERLTDITIDDDKLEHSSKTFCDHGLQRSGFRGRRCGPVMHAAGTAIRNKKENFLQHVGCRRRMG